MPSWSHGSRAHKGGRTFGATACFLERNDLGVRPTEFTVIPLPHQMSVPHDHTAHERIGVHTPPATPCECSCPLEVGLVLASER